MTEERISVLIFGGTSEGRELAEYAASRRVRTLVSVVSEYGEGLLAESDCVRVRRGALSREEMKELLNRVKPELVLDATHPYARVVTERISELCRDLSIPYQRVLRENEDGQTEHGIYRVKTLEEAVSVLAQDDEPVLLTTGSKELAVFAAAEHLDGRLFVRVLPDSRVLAGCEALGIHGAHLIAMQGPFSVAMNRALLEQTGAKWLVTKESGSRGGFTEKLQAARESGASVIVIERPEREHGMSPAEARAIMDRYGDVNSRHPLICETGTKRTLSLIGMGMGGGRQLTLESIEALKQCDAVLGAPRMLEDVAPWTKHAVREARYLPGPVLDWLNHHSECHKAAVVYSGDTGFYSGSGSLIHKIQEADCLCDWKIQVFPGISSVSNLCARMQTSWEHLYLASAHGRDCDVVSLIEQHERVFLLLGGSENLQSVCRKLTEGGYGRTVVRAGVRMGYADEAWVTGTAERLADQKTEELAAVILERE